MGGYKKPETIIAAAGYCGGCGHGVIQRLIAESLEEMELVEKAVNVVDIACCFWSLDALNLDGIAGPHGRCAAVATAMKKVRPDDIIYIHAGDGASYTIGLSETSYAAIRDIPITMIVVNNAVFGMTGGQMAPATTLIGDKTTSSPYGRVQSIHGEPADFLQVLSNYNIEFAARGALFSPQEIDKTKKLLKKAFQNQVDKKGFSIVEILSPCPTNWGLAPIDANIRVKEVMTKKFPIKTYVDRGGRS